MLKLLKGVGAGELLEFSADEEGKRLEIKIKGRYLRTFDIATLEVPEEVAPEPKFTFNTSIRMLSSDFVRALADAEKVSDHACLEMDSEKFAIIATGDLGSIRVEFASRSKSVIDFSVKESSKASYSLRYLIDMTKGAALTSDKVVIEYSTDRPIKLDFEMPKGYLRFYLAPRIEAV
jgi:proliferating cell nuclear antigen